MANLKALLESAATEAMVTRAKPRKIAAHNCGDCTRALWYGEHDYTPAPMDGALQTAFDVGDAFESSLAIRLEALGVGFVRLGYADTVDCPPIGRVRADGIMPDAVVEIKALSPYPFEKAAGGEIGEKYRAQIEVEMRGHGRPRGIWLAVNKGNGALLEMEFGPDDALWARLCESAEAARGAAKPERPYALVTDCEGCHGSGRTATGKQAHRACGGSGKLTGGPLIPAFPCGWCGYRDECYNTSELEEIVTTGRYGKQVTRYRCRDLLAERLRASLSGGGEIEETKHGGDVLGERGEE